MSYQLDQEKGIAPKPTVQEIEQPSEPVIETEIEQPEQVESATIEKTTSEVEAAPVKQAEESQEQLNFKVLRKARERAERERDEALRRLEDYENGPRRAANPQQAPTDDDELTIGNDELAEGKHLRKVDKKIRDLEQKLRDQMQRNALVTTEVKLRSELPDFDKVVSEENIEVLKETHPELAYTLEMTPDMYTKAKAAYKIIKSMGIYRPADAYQQDKAKAQINSAKPRPVASISPQTGDSPLSRANAFEQGLTDELRAQLIKEMETARRNM